MKDADAEWKAFLEGLSESTRREVERFDYTLSFDRGAFRVLAQLLYQDGAWRS